MKDWLEKYNLADVQPLVEAIERSFECFYRYFGEDANTYQSLPAVAQSALYRMYDQSCSHIFSFIPTHDDIRAMHRETLVGGLVNIFHRHIYIGVIFYITYFYILY